MQGEMKSISYNVGVESFINAIVGTQVDLTYMASIMNQFTTRVCSP